MMADAQQLRAHRPSVQNGGSIPRPVLAAGPWHRRAVAGTFGALARSIELAATVLHRVPLPINTVAPSVIRDGPVIFVANHRSLLDTPFLRWSLPREVRRHLVTVGGYDFFEPRSPGWRRRCEVLFLQFIVHGYRVWMIDRRLDGMAHLPHLSSLLEAGWSLLLYPEGRRSRDGHLGAMQPGAAILSLRTGAAVVPLFISGSERALPPGVCWPRHATLTIRSGAPMRARADESPECFLDRIRGALVELSRGQECRA